MNKFEDHYRTLQVHHEAKQEIIDAAYKRLCKMYHPDLNSDDLHNVKMIKINLSYEIIGNINLRNDYHESWIKYQNQDNLRILDSTNNDEAYQLLNLYFLNLMDCEWEGAYSILTERDQQNVSFSDFKEWQENVSKIYKMGSYVITPFREYENCTIDNSQYLVVKEFSVYVCDLDKRTQKINENDFIKYVVQEKNLWKICLGYSNLKPIILKYKYMNDQLTGLDIQNTYNEVLINQDSQTGKASRAGFLKTSQKEASRSNRYGNQFSIAIILLKAYQISGSDDEYLRMGICMASDIIENNIRQTDIIGRWSSNELAILFTETPKENAIIICEKLVHKINLNADFEFILSYGVSQYKNLSVEETIMKAVSQAHIKTSTHNGVTTTQIIAYTSEN